MKILRKKFDLEQLDVSEKLNVWGIISHYSEFNNYNLSEDGIHIIATLPKQTSEFFFNKNETLKEYYTLGKKLYNIYEELLKDFHSKNKQGNNSELNFIDIKYLHADIKNNFYIDKFLPFSVLNNSITKNDVTEIVLNYCLDNGLPLNYDEDLVTIYENFNNDKNNKVETVYFCLIQPFISISILIYIFLELQDALKNIFAILIYEKITISEKTTFNDIIKDNQYIFEEYKQTIEKFLWFMNYDTNNINELNILHFCSKFCKIFNSINNSTAYLGFKNVLYFSTSKQRFFNIEIYSSVMAMAWEYMSRNILSYINNEMVAYFKKCKNCGHTFYPSDIKEKYCSEECINLANNTKSNRSYNKLKQVFSEFKKTFNNLTKEQLSKLSKTNLNQIKKIANMKMTDIKNNSDYKDKDKTKTETLQKYIDIMNNIK